MTWIAIALILIPLAGYFAWNLRSVVWSRIVCWGITVGAVLGTHLLSTQEPAGTRMLLIIIALLWSMKAVVMNEARIGKSGFRLTPFQWLAFAIGWPGMRPSLFAGVPGPALKNTRSYIQRGCIRLTIGLVLFAAAYLVWHQWALPQAANNENAPKLLTLLPSVGSAYQIVTSFLLMLAFSLSIHFGIFNIVTGCWRSVGAKCNALFVAPLHSRTLSEFWGRRWNLAFSEMTTWGVFRPLKKVVGKGPATFCAFLFSGLLHELAISVPVQAGYGLPLIYFGLHGAAMLLESHWLSKTAWFNDHAWWPRVWTICWIILPLPILFHGPFLAGCLWPLVQW